MSEAQGQSEANDAAQGSEVDADAQALIDLVTKRQEEKKAAEAERLAAEARQRKEAEDEAAAIARDEAFDEDASFDYFNKSGRQPGANEVKKFLTKKSLAEQKKNPTTVRDILQHYLDTESDPLFSVLAEALINVPGVGDVPISYTLPDEEGDLGVYRTQRGAIEVHDGAGWQTVFHEVAHAATVRGFVDDKELRRAIKSLYKRVKLQAQVDGVDHLYGFTNELEFLAEALSNPEFQSYLKSVDFADKPNFWKQFVDAVKNFFMQFMPEAPDDTTAFNAALSLALRAIEVTGDAGDVRVNRATLEDIMTSENLALYNKAFTQYTDKLMDTSLGDVAGAARDTLNNLIVSVNNTAFLAKWRPDLESLQKIHAAETKMQASQGKNANAVMDKVDDIRNLEKPERTKLFTLMVDSTRARMHPDRPLDDKTNAHIPNTPENEVLHRDLAARFNALTPDARKAYQETRDLFQKMFEQRTKALFALSERLLTEKKREQFKENINRLSKEMPGPYFPLARFGNYVSVWKSKDYAKAQKENDTTAMERLKRDPEHYVVSFHSSQAQASRALKKMIAKMGDRSALGTTEKVDGEKVDTKMHFSYALERNAYDGGVTMDLRPLLEKMQSAVETTVGAENSKGAKDALAEIFIASLSDTNVLKSALKRENIEGVKPEEMLRAVAKHGSAQAFHISRLEHMADIQDALKELRAEDSMAINKGERFSVYNTVAGALTGMYTGDPNTVAARAVNATNFLLYNGRLALNPAFWLTNAMAPLVVSVPYMRGRFKLNAVMDEYRSSFVDAVKVVLPKGLKDATRFSLLDAIENAKDLSAGERKMLLSLMDEGLIDENQIRELSNVAEGDIGVKDNLARYLGAIPHRVEALNRVSTALTAYRLQLGRDKDADAATRYAMEATAETQVNYTTAGTPYLLRKNGWLGAPAAKLFTQFVRYQLGMVQLIGHNFREAFGSKKVGAKTREEARRKFYALLTMHTAMSGASGLFGASAFMAVAQGVTNMFRDDDDEVDLEQEMRKLSDDIFGKDLSRGVRKGVPAMFGFDLSSRLGMGDMLSIRRENPFKGDAGEIKSKLVDDLSPSVSNLINWYDWFQKGFPMKKIPISLVANLAKASELYGKGMVSAHGVVKKGPEDYNAADITLQGLGFTPTESSDAFAEQSSVRAKEKAITSARESLIDAWNNAMADNDKEGVADARKKILEFNARHSDKRDFQITPDTLTKSRKQRLARQKRMNDAGVFIPKRGEWRNQ